MNKSIKTADDSNKLILKESKGCVFFRLFPFCRICKDKDLSPKEIQNSQNAFLQSKAKTILIILQIKTAYVTKIIIFLFTRLTANGLWTSKKNTILQEFQLLMK